MWKEALRMPEKIIIEVGSSLTVKDLSCTVARTCMKDLTLPNPEYVTRSRLGLWIEDMNETITLADFRRVDDTRITFIFPRGYIERFIDRLKAAGLEYDIEDRRLAFLPIDFSLGGVPRPYQSKALQAMKPFGSGVLVAPCGSGKTILGLALIALRRQPALILVHTKDLLKQTCEAVRQWLKIEPGIIGEGDFHLGVITVATVQTLHARPEILEQAKGHFGLVLLDEAHHCPATTFTVVMQAFPAAYRYGLTATPERRDGLFPFLEAVIGPVRHEITNADLRRAAVLVVPRIEYVKTDFSCFCSEWTDIIGTLTEDEDRNALALAVIEKALDEGRQVLALSERVAHARRLATMMESRRQGVSALAVGSLGKKAREEALGRMRSGEARVLFATKLADEGLDIPNLNALVLLTPCRDGARTTQRAGRILRAVPGKAQPVIYDLVDSRVGLLQSQARTRFFECYRMLVPGMRLPPWLKNRRSV
jgi:superfamily II DNA or RNA helicase